MLSAKEYLQDRWRTLRPIPHKAVNPIRLLTSLTGQQWSFFLLGFFAWSWDAFDFHSVTLSYPDLTEEFGRTQQEMSLAITFVLMCRPLGGAFFGILADKYGRKWPFIANCCLLIIFVLATGFCHTYSQFLAVRALFGIAMGGIYGNAAATALEDCPEEARGLLSGCYQNGYPFGYVLASAFYAAFHERTKGKWRTLFWFGSTPPILLIIFRYYLPETAAFQSRRMFRSQQHEIKGAFGEVGLAVKRYWLLLLYLILLLTGMVYLSHGTQDIYPLLLRQKYKYSVRDTTIIQVVASIGGMVGGTFTGYCSQIFGRRFSIIVVCFLGGALLYPYNFTQKPGIYAAAFFEQFCVQGAWSIIPIHLIELSPPAFRTFVVGTAYQMGVLVASPCNNILAKIGSRYPLRMENVDGKEVRAYDYSLAMCAFTACIFVYVIVIAGVGPEKLGIGTAEESDESDVEMADSGACEGIGNARF